MLTRETVESNYVLMGFNHAHYQYASNPGRRVSQTFPMRYRRSELITETLNRPPCSHKSLDIATLWSEPTLLAGLVGYRGYAPRFHPYQRCVLTSLLIPGGGSGIPVYPQVRGKPTANVSNPNNHPFAGKRSFCRTSTVHPLRLSGCP